MRVDSGHFSPVAWHIIRSKAGGEEVEERH